MCRVLQVSRSGFYAWLGRVESDRARENRQLIELIRGVFAESREVYGAPRVFRTLRHRSVSCGRHRVARLMRIAGMRSKTRRRFRVKTTDSDHDLPVAPNRLRQDFTATSPNQVWVSDITYIPTGEGWLYLATTMDLFSRRIVGWSMAETLHSEIVIDALTMATKRPPNSINAARTSVHNAARAKESVRTAISAAGNAITIITSIVSPATFAT